MSVSSITPPKAASSINKKASVPPPSTLRSSPLKHDEIAKKAYEIYVKSGYQKERCKQNWEQAEQELKAASQKLK